MKSVIQFDYAPEGVTIPSWVEDLASFTQWTNSSEFPEIGRVSYLNGTIYLDLSPEQLFAHNRLKVEVTGVLDKIVSNAQIGYVYTEGARLQNVYADFSLEPDAMFVSVESLRVGRVIFVDGSDGTPVFVDGSPDVVVEVVSDCSEQQDREDLRDAYYAGGITEYWLFDAREDEPVFELFKRAGSKGYLTSRVQQDRWRKSEVFGKWFRLTQKTDPLGNPQYALEHRD